MQLIDKQVSRFQELYKENFGVEISAEEAREKGIKLVCLVEVVLKEQFNRRTNKIT